MNLTVWIIFILVMTFSSLDYLWLEFCVLILCASVLRFDLNEFALNLCLLLDDVADGKVIGRAGGAGWTSTEHIGGGGGAWIYNTGRQTVQNQWNATFYIQTRLKQVNYFQRKYYLSPLWNLNQIFKTSFDFCFKLGNIPLDIVSKLSYRLVNVHKSNSLRTWWH